MGGSKGRRTGNVSCAGGGSTRSPKPTSIARAVKACGHAHSDAFVSSVLPDFLAADAFKVEDDSVVHRFRADLANTMNDLADFGIAVTEKIHVLRRTVQFPVLGNEHHRLSVSRRSPSMNPAASEPELTA